MRKGLSLPGNGEKYCEKCAKKRQSFHSYLYHQRGIKELAALKKTPGLRFFFTDHAWERYHEREFTALDLMKSFQSAWLVERQEDMGSPAWVILVYLHKEPVHLVIKMKSANRVDILTIYDPRTEAWRWSHDFKRRVCWCKKGGKRR